MILKTVTGFMCEDIKILTFYIIIILSQVVIMYITQRATIHDMVGLGTILPRSMAEFNYLPKSM